MSPNTTMLFPRNFFITCREGVWWLRKMCFISPSHNKGIEINTPLINVLSEVSEDVAWYAVIIPQYALGYQFCIFGKFSLWFQVHIKSEASVSCQSYFNKIILKEIWYIFLHHLATQINFSSVAEYDGVLIFFFFFVRGRKNVLESEKSLPAWGLGSSSLMNV